MAEGDSYGLGSIGVPGMILIIIVALIVFGPKKLPEIGKAIGQTVKEFKSSANDAFSDGLRNNYTEEKNE